MLFFPKMKVSSFIYFIFTNTQTLLYLSELNIYDFSNNRRSKNKRAFQFSLFWKLYSPSLLQAMFHNFYE